MPAWAISSMVTACATPDRSVWRWTRCSRPTGRPLPLRRMVAVLSQMSPEDVSLPGRAVGPGLHGPGRDLRPRRRGAAVPARRRAAGLRRRGSGTHRPRAWPSGSTPSRPSSPTSTASGAHPRRRRDPAPRRHELAALPPGRPRRRPAERRPDPRGRDRPRPGRGRRVPGARGQHPLPVGRQLRAREPRGRWRGCFPSCSGPPSPARSPTIRPGCCGPARGRPGRGAADPTVVVLTPGVLQLGLLRARVSRPPDGRRAGRGPRPRLPRHRRLHADHRGRAAGPRRSTAGSTTTSSTRCTSAPTRSSAARAPQRRPGRQRGHLANAVGNGVADDKLVYTYVPE